MTDGTASHPGVIGTGQRVQAQEHLATARTMYREKEAEAEMTDLE